jgi:hypothetical protein
MNQAAVQQIPLPHLNLMEVPDGLRLDFLPDHHLVDFESFLYDLAGKYLEDYTGGYWKFYHIESTLDSEEDFAPLIVLDQTVPVCISNADNHTGPFVTDILTASVAINLIFLSHLSFKTRDHKHIDYYHILREWAFDQDNQQINQAVVAAITD